MADRTETERRKALKTAAQRLIVRGQLAEALLDKAVSTRSTADMAAWCWDQIEGLVKEGKKDDEE